MTNPDMFRITDPGKLMQLALLRPLATIIGVDGIRPVIDHAPALCRTVDDVVYVRFFLDAASPACDALRKAGQGVAVFGGPSSYISPDWYGAGDYGPSWNYLSAEAEGPCRHLETGECRQLFDDLAAFFEKKLWPKSPWTSEALTPDALDDLLGRMCAFELKAERFEGVRKLSQNQRRDARQKAGEALALAGGDPAIAAMMMNDVP